MSSVAENMFAPEGGDDDGGLRAVCAQVRAGVQALAGLDRDALADPELGGLLVGLVADQQVLAAGVAHVASAFEATGEHRDAGLSTLKSWLAWQCRISPADARRLCALATVLRDRPALDAALAVGEVTLSHAQVLAGLARHPRFRDAYASEQGEPLLLDHARSLEFREFQLAVEYWKLHVDEDGTEKAAEDDHQARNVEVLDGLRGTGLLKGELTPTCRESFETELARLETELFHTDWAAAEDALGRAPELHELARTTGQRRHDALELMSERSARPDHTAGKRPEPLLTIHLGETSFERLCELASGRLITPGQVLPYLDRAWVERILWDTKSRVIDVGQQRSFTGATRRAVQVKYRSCAWPGCQTPVGKCHIDHIQAHSRGGATGQLNGQPLCPKHNGMKGTLPAEALPRFDQPGRTTHHPHNSPADSPADSPQNSRRQADNGRAGNDHRDSGDNRNGPAAATPARRTPPNQPRPPGPTDQHIRHKEHPCISPALVP